LQNSYLPSGDGRENPGRRKKLGAGGRPRDPDGSESDHKNAGEESSRSGRDKGQTRSESLMAAQLQALRDQTDPAAELTASSEPTDAELIQRTLAGERDAFEGVVSRYQDRAYWAAVNLLGDPEEARDVAQEAFLRAYKALGRFDFGMSFYTWLYRIVVNLSIDQLRRKSRFRPISLDDVGGGLPGDEERDEPTRSMEAKDSVRLVHKILELLPEKYRTVMVLRDLNSLSCKEIASIVRSTHSTVRWRLHMARKMFRSHWERLERSADNQLPKSELRQKELRR
jgi:RNA polymerase sigma-70 factor (ECF subfamily)